MQEMMQSNEERITGCIIDRGREHARVCLPPAQVPKLPSLSPHTPYPPLPHSPFTPHFRLPFASPLPQPPTSFHMHKSHPWRWYSPLGGGSCLVLSGGWSLGGDLPESTEKGLGCDPAPITPHTHTRTPLFSITLAPGDPGALGAILGWGTGHVCRIIRHFSHPHLSLLRPPFV